jgi:hypothetical protein
MFILSDEQAEDGTFVRGFPEHVQMIKDFVDDKKIKHFVALLLDDPATAFEIYNNA